MLDTDTRSGDDGSDRFVEATAPIDVIGDKAAWDARRRIERLRELRRLRELLDDPNFNELD
jgi:hypothetical protein